MGSEFSPTPTDHGGWAVDGHGAGGRFQRATRHGRDRWSAFGATPDGKSDVRLTLPARPENVAVVRHVLGALAEAIDLPRNVIEDLRLAVTEACTNVVRHAYLDGDGLLDVVVHPDGDSLRVIVSDRGRGISPSADRNGPGLGLPLIAALTDSLEIKHAPGNGSSLCMGFRRDRERGGAAPVVEAL